uniref:Uncharacterized protein n=1 Tax=Anopheles stephensi TaxID=30069 RepID=A0A182YNB2_ANOST
MELKPVANPSTMKVAIARGTRSLAASTTDPKIIYLDRLCRTCLVETKKDQLKDLFELSLAEKIMSCTSVTVTETDGLPCHICTDCCLELERTFNFRQMSKASDATIRSLIEKSVVITQDSETKYEVLNVVLTDSDGNTETSAVVVPIEELRFQLMNTTSKTVVEMQAVDDSSVSSRKAIQICRAPQQTSVSLESSEKEPYPGQEFSPNMNPNDLLNEQSSTTSANKESSEQPRTQALRESTILRNLKQELSEFIGSNCTAISKEVEIVDENEDDELIHVDYLKDALTEEYIQIMENQLASTVANSKEQEQVEQEHLNSLIHASMEAEEPSERQKTEDGVERDTTHCKICDMQFSKRRLYYKHVSRKHSDLKTHNYVHTGEKNYSCDVCNKTFSSSANRNTHRKTHNRKTT